MPRPGPGARHGAPPHRAQGNGAAGGRPRGGPFPGRGSSGATLEAAIGIEIEQLSEGPGLPQKPLTWRKMTKDEKMGFAGVVPFEDGRPALAADMTAVDFFDGIKVETAATAFLGGEGLAIILHEQRPDPAAQGVETYAREYSIGLRASGEVMAYLGTEMKTNDLVELGFTMSKVS